MNSSKENEKHIINSVISLIDDVVSYFDKHVDYVNDLNVFPVPDGDTGTNMYRTLKGVQSRVNEQELFTIGDLSKVISLAALYEGRGNSGVILAQIIRGLFSCLNETIDWQMSNIPAALSTAKDKAYSSVSEPVEGTMLTVIGEISDKLNDFFSETDTNLKDLLTSLSGFAQKSVNDTPNHMQLLKDSGVVDSGGYGIEIIVKAIELSCLQPRSLDASLTVRTPEDSGNKIKQALGDHFDHGDEYGFCTQFVLISETDETVLRNKLENLCTSLVVLSESPVHRVHLHTNDVDDVMSNAKKIGEIQDLSVEDMEKQAFGSYSNGTEALNVDEDLVKMIVLSSGEGNKEMFLELGAATVFSLSPDSNPSVSELLGLFKQFESSDVDLILLPNDKNIFSAASEAAKMTKLNIKIIPTQNLGQGLECAAEFDPQMKLEINEKLMLEIIPNIENIFIFPSARNMSINNTDDVLSGDPIAMKSGSIIDSAKTLDSLLVKILKSEMNLEYERVIILIGKDRIKSQVDDFLSKNVESVVKSNIETYYGGQDHYDYLVSIIK
ncbi:MAG: hypothetical protein CL699_05345 [Chloroflexi bacterium]|nr:hypothetical protein [Chloroflexota bacterium]